MGLFLLIVSCAGGAPSDTSGLEDADGDGWNSAEDCHDYDAAIHPDADEHCDGEDEDCDGAIDEDPVDPSERSHPDEDGDGHGHPDDAPGMCDPPDTYVASADDCDDLDESSYPGAPELCDGVDNDCDGEVDDGDCVEAGS